MSLVSFVNLKDFNMREAIRDSLILINYKFPRTAQNIVIKPNMCYYWDYSTGTTTDPKFIAGLVDVIRNNISPDVKITIVESDASAMKCKYAFKMLGYEKLAQKHHLCLMNLSNDETEKAKVKIKDHVFTFRIPKTIKDADLKINVTKIKYSLEKIKITCALKNIFGCNPYPKKFKYHSKLDETIVALNKLMKFDLCLVDGNIVSGVQPRKLGLVMASKDPVAIDVAAAKIAGVNPKTIKYIELASKEGLGSTSFIAKGAPWHYFKERYPRKSAKSKLLSKAYNLVLTLGLSKQLGLD